MTQAALKTSPALSRYPEIIHGFGTRQPYDLAARAAKVVSLNQIHSNKVYVYEGVMPNQPPQADAVVTNLKDAVLTIRTADCLPVLIYNPKCQAVAAIHAGFRGLLNGVLQNSLTALQENYGSRPEDVVVALGPCISVDHYEVGDEVIAAFQKAYGERLVFYQREGERPYLDVRRTALNVLESCGVLKTQMDDVSFCTYACPDEFYSYRRSKDQGRMVSFISLNK